MNQTATEIEPISWVVGGKCVMGFKMLGSSASIKKAIDHMLLVVRKMDNAKAGKIINSHLVTLGIKKTEKASKPDPKEGASTSTSTSKSSKICVHYTKGTCTYGAKCRFLHKASSK